MTYLEAYLKLVQDTPSPEIYHKFVALFVVGASAHRKVWLEVAHRRLFPNLYVVFVSSPGSYKGTAMSIGRSFFRADDNRRWITAPNRTTLAALLNRLSDEQTAQMEAGLPVNGTKVCFSDELVDFVGLRDLDRLTFLNDLYDGLEVFDNDTKTAGYDFIREPCLCLLGCTTRDMLSECLGRHGFNSGFASRTIFVSSEESTYKCLLESHKVDSSLRDRVLETLNWAQAQGGAMKITKEALTRYDAWQRDTDNFQRTTPLDSSVKALYARMPTQTAKLSMVYALADQRMEVIIEDVHSAISLMHIVEQNFEPLYRSSGQDSLAGYKMTILEALKTLGPIKVRDLYTIHWHNIPESKLSLVLNTLINSGYIEEVFIGDKPWIKMKTVEKEDKVKTLVKEVGKAAEFIGEDIVEDMVLDIGKYD